MIPPFFTETERCRQVQRIWSRLPIWQRLRCVRRFRHLLVDAADELALTVTQDIGRSADEVLITDILPTADACRFLERQAARLLRARRVPILQRPLWLFGAHDTVHRRSHGVVGIIGTWNYPIFLNAVQIMHALAAGNGVLWKPSELTPMLATALHQLILHAGFPPDLCIQLPATREAGPELAEANVDHIVFTGSADVGKKLARRLGERLISSTLELSGCDAMFVAADANLTMAAQAAWWGVTLNSGQTCLAIRRIFVERAVYQPFLDQLRLLGKASYARPLMLPSQAANAQRLVREAVEQGAGLLSFESTPKAEDDPPRYPPTFVVEARADMAICREAYFAPVAAVLPCDRLDDAIELQANCPFALGASIFTSNRRRAHSLARALHVGMVAINDVIAPTAHPATPFGGRKESGWGTTQGPEGLLAMTVPQVVTNRKGAFRPHYATSHRATTATGELMRGLTKWRYARGWRQRGAGFWQMIRAAMRYPLGEK